LRQRADAVRPYSRKVREGGDPTTRIKARPPLYSMGVRRN